MYLAHHGIKGQKWGVRRYQNSDGTLTEEGKKRYIKRDTIIGGTVGAAVGGYAGAIAGAGIFGVINPAAAVSAGAAYAAALGGVSLGSVMAYSNAKASRASAKRLLETHPNITNKELVKACLGQSSAQYNSQAARVHQQFMRQNEINNFTMYQLGIY